MSKQHAINGTFGLALVLLGSLAWAQQAQIGELEETLARVDARATGGPSLALELSGRESDLPADGSQPPPPRPPPGRFADTPPNGAPPVRPPSPRAQPENPAGFDPADPLVRGQLREVIAEEQQVIQDERWQKRSARREERLRAQLKELGQRTEMDPVVNDQLTDLVVVEQAELSELFRQAREDFSWDEVREKSAAVRAETDQKAKDLLEPEEYEEFSKMREEEEARFGGRGRGPRGGDRGSIAP